MEKKKIHLIANAHLDLVWLWRWEEGCTEAISTFETAANLLEEYEEFKFNHNEAILYEWVQKNRPVLFERIKELVKQGKWEIIGGWYLQPDCNMPAGESIVRNIMIGRRYFLEQFGVYPDVAVNFDAFGHSRGLIQILNQAGYQYYLAMRPPRGNYDFDDADFIWNGFAGSKLLAHRNDEGYNSIWGKAVEGLDKFAELRGIQNPTLFHWGVGDHGGGPTRKDLDDFRAFMKKGDYEIVHSTPNEYFSELEAVKKELNEVSRGLNPVAEGCYTSQIRVKQLHRQLENEIFSTEKMACAASVLYGRTYGKDTFDEAVRALIFSEFHDALPGSGSKLVEDDTIRLLNYGLELMSREKLYSAIALASGERKAEPDTSVMMFYNPHPFDITGVFECDTGLPKQNWDPSFMYPIVEFNGEKIPVQAEKEESNFGIDWRKKVVVQATLKAFSMNRMDVKFEPIPKRPEYENIDNKEYFIHETEELFVKINTRTGLMDEYRINGICFLKENSFQLQMTDDTYNAWGLGKEESACRRYFQLLSPHEGSSFSGLMDQVIPSVRMIEDGPVRTVIEAVFGLQDSKAYVRYMMPKKGTAVDIEVMVQFNEKEQSLKLMLHNAAGENGTLEGQIIYGREQLVMNGREAVAQKWAMVSDEDADKALLILNNGTYGLNYDRGRTGITLLRAAGYSAADDAAGKALREKRYAPRMEQGERFYQFRLDGGNVEEMSRRADNQALIFNERPYVFSYCPPGPEDKSMEKTVDSFLRIDNEAVVVSALKRAEDSEELVLRVYESTGKSQKAVLICSALGIEYNLDLTPNEVKTLMLSHDGVRVTSLLEGLEDKK